MLVRQLLATLALATAAVAAGAAPVWAHAVLERSDPPAYRLVLKSPEGLVLTFSEPIDPGRTEIRVLDQEGRAVSLGAASLSTDRRQVRVPIRLPGPGIYTVAWRTLSVVDQHIYEGVYTITVGPLRPGSFTLRAGVPAGPAPWEVVARWLTFLGAAVLTGGVLLHRMFLARPHRPTESPLFRTLERRWLGLVRLGAGVVLVGSAGELAVQATQAGSAAGEVFVTSLVQVAASEPVRTSLVFKVAVPLMLLLLVPRSASAAVLLALAGLLPLGISLTGHAAAASSPLPLVADWLHLTSAALWVGGLFYLALVLAPGLRSADSEERTRILGVLVPRFSTLAIAAVAVLVLTGAYATWTNVPGVSAARATPYGRVLAVKLLLLIPMLAVAAVNLLSLRPRLAGAARSPAPQSDPWPLQRRFFRLVRSEAALGTVVLVAAAVLVLLPTSRQVQALNPIGRPFVLVRQAGDITARLGIDPYHVGESVFALTLQNREGAPVRDARVRLTFQPMFEQLGTTSADAVPEGDGRFTLKGAYIGTRGPWMLKVLIRIRGKEDDEVSFLAEPEWERGDPPSPPTHPPALAALRSADETMNGLRSMRQRQELTDGRGSHVTTLSEFAAPEAMRFQVVGGMQGIFIGERRFFREGGTWQPVLMDIRFRFPNYTFAEKSDGVLFGPREVLNGSRAQVIVFILKAAGAKARYAVWIDEGTGLVVREAMAAPGHYMLTHNYDFNVPLRISPPIGK
jgi:copper transport protein